MSSQTNLSDGPAGRIEENVGAADLRHLLELATLVTAARDAMSDDIVTRMSSAVNEGLILLDRVTRNPGLMRLLQALERSECQSLLEALADALTATSRELVSDPTGSGAGGGLLRLLRDPGTRDTLRLVCVLGGHLSRNLEAATKVSVSPGGSGAPL